jgi:hypothetical protein
MQPRMQRTASSPLTLVDASPRVSAETEWRQSGGAEQAVKPLVCIEARNPCCLAALTIEKAQQAFSLFRQCGRK